MPTRSSCSIAGGSPSAVAMASCWRRTACMPTCGGASRRPPPKPNARSRRCRSRRPSGRRGISVSPTSPAIADPRRTLLPVFAACAAIGLQAGVGMPLVPLALEQQGHDKLTIGIVSATWAIAMLAFGTRIPALAARFGAVPAIVGAVVIGALINAAYTVTSGPLAWGILTFLHGMVGGVP